MNPTPLWKRVAPVALGALGLLWFLFIWLYIVRSNVPLLSVYQGVVGFWYFRLTHLPPLELVQALIHSGLCGLLGWWLLDAVGHVGGRIERGCAAWLLGLGVAGIAFELLTMAGLLYPVAAWLLWALLLAGAWAARKAVAVRRWSLEPVYIDAPVMDEREPHRLPFGLESGLFWLLATLTGLITALTFYHALLFPETYWDSLILYLGYGRMTFLEHSFPFKAEVQVGIGLGANYPHLFSNYGAVGSTLFGHWSDVHQRLAAPVAGLATCVLLYTVLRRMSGRPLVAMAAVTALRAIPYGIAYHTWASDYALAIALAAILIWAADLFLRSPSRGNLVVLTLVPAISMHLNYLMGLLWVPWGVAVLLAALRDDGWRGVLESLKPRRMVLVIFAAGVLLASPWYIRNWVLTGNPVYAFFPQFFPGSVRMNVDVLRSAELEWFRVGDGIGKAAELYHDIENGQQRDDHAPDYRREANLSDRLRASFFFWVGFDTVTPNAAGEPMRGRWVDRIAHLLRLQADMDGMPQEVAPNQFVLRTRHAYKMSPFVPGLLVPSVLIALALMIPRVRRALVDDNDAALVAVAGTLLAGFFAYNYLLADFYLYQIIAFVAPATIVVGLGLIALERASRWLLGAGAALIAAAAIFPGVPFALMNFKAFGNVTVDGATYNTLALDHFRQPGMPASLFMRLRFGDDVGMWEHINNRPEITRLLTHDNRHYVYRTDLTIVHLDDWDVQQLYGTEDPATLAAGLRALDLEFYLYIENEDRHTVNSRLGMKRLLEAGYLEELHRSGSNVLYRILSAPRTN